MLRSVANVIRPIVILCAVAAIAGAQTAIPMAINPADIDTTCKPCENFYKYATGGWAKRTEIPAAFSSWSSFNELSLRNEQTLKDILDRSARQAETTNDPNVRKLGRFYASCMDSVAIEKRGMDPIRADLARIDRITTRAQLMDEIRTAHIGRVSGARVFGGGAGTDPENSKRVIFNVAQGGLGLPDRDFYFRTDTNAVAIRKAYVEYIADMLALTGMPVEAAEAAAPKVMAMEMSFADAALTRVQQRDPRARYHFISVAAADSLTPGWSWRAYFAALGLTKVDSFNVAHPEFFKRFAKELAERPIEDWRAYLRFHTVNNVAGTLSSAYVNRAFAFSSKLSGAREQQPRQRRCVGAADGLLTDALGREYVKDAFTPEAKKSMDEMIDNLMSVYRTRLATLPWMGEATRKEALRKLSTFGRKIGYPSEWKDYSTMDIKPGVWFENLRAANVWATDRSRARVGKAPDKGEWSMSPPTVNAYYSPSNNEIGFPAGRMQPPFYHPSYDLGANYGGIGATIGHETSHGFDDQGRKYDADGNLRDWWTADDAIRFGELAARIEQQYSAYTVLDGLHVIGKQTLGEDIADNSGVAIAYQALQLALKDKPREKIDGFTPEQRFFLGWAQARRSISRDQALRLQVQTDVHSPSEFRVNGPLSNMPEFAAAFGCKAGDPMVRPNPIRIW